MEVAAILPLMKVSSIRLAFLFRLVGTLLFLRWTYIFISTDLYLFSNPRSCAFWGTGIKRTLIAALISSGLFISTLKIGQKYWIGCIFMIFISVACSFFLAPETGDWIFWLASTVIHGLAIFKIFKARSFKPQQNEGHSPSKPF